MKHFFIYVILFCCLNELFSQNKNILVDGEDLFYNVRYGFIDLGSIRMKTKKVFENGNSFYKTQAYIDSYDFPFVDIHVFYENYYDENGIPIKFISIENTSEENNFLHTIYDFDYNEKKIFIKNGFGTKNKMTKITYFTSIILDTEYQNSLSIFFYARMNNHFNTNKNVPTFHANEKTSTKINYTNKIEKIKTDFADFPVETKYLNGTMSFIGVFGLTGFFEGWFSNDADAVPILAKMKVLIGNIIIELKNWKRNDWILPK